RFNQSSISDAVTVPSTVFNGFKNSAYVEAQVRPSSYPNGLCRGTIFRKRGDFNDWGLDLRSDGTVECYLPNGGARGGSVPLNQWSKVACSWDGSAITLKINEQLVASGAATGAIPDWLANYFTTEIGNDTHDTGINCPDYAFRGDI